LISLLFSFGIGDYNKIWCLPGDHPPADDEGFLEFARSLPAPDLYDTVRMAQPRSPISLYARTANERRHYERVDMPDGVVVLGDAACCFNPIYGQARMGARIIYSVFMEGCGGHSFCAGAWRGVV